MYHNQLAMGRIRGLLPHFNFILCNEISTSLSVHSMEAPPSPPLPGGPLLEPILPELPSVDPAITRGCLDPESVPILKRCLTDCIRFLDSKAETTILRGRTTYERLLIHKLCNFFGLESRPMARRSEAIAVSRPEVRRGEGREGKRSRPRPSRRFSGRAGTISAAPHSLQLENNAAFVILPCSALAVECLPGKPRKLRLGLYRTSVTNPTTPPLSPSPHRPHPRSPSPRTSPRPARHS